MLDMWAGYGTLSVVKWLLTVLAGMLTMGSGSSGENFDPPLLNPDPLIVPHSAESRDSAGGGVAPHNCSVGEARSFPASATVPRDQTRVAVLGYHNFSETQPVTEMLLRTSEFRAQMESIRLAGLRVISMQEFLEWRFGARELPAKCVLITLDDGWRSVYTDAYPILREYGYPFHVFLYTRYLSGRGASMSPNMVREMMRYGASVGSHSTNHHYPSRWKQVEAKGAEEYGKMVDAEIGDSQRRLEMLFGSCKTYCYPGGYITQPMLDRLPGYGYVAAFTVVPGKVTSSEDPWQIHRYMIFGNDPSVFKSAMDFRVAQQGNAISTGASPGTLPKKTPLPPFAVSPKPHEIVSEDIPVIEAHLNGVVGVDFSTVRMKVSGFGRVPAKVDASSRLVSWEPPCRIYMPNISVHVTWNSTDGASNKAEWSFNVEPKVAE